ncbi:hypothetical protein H920_08946 [Fukomys damarensis]|uniref:Uncharacterized protein n=1 Tax=Fukomys damarensis TaxID=885580 RepID=A0A091DF18_FUKDA|nr:hypothetical protein H920_08946 [Fukomys damarensis]
MMQHPRIPHDTNITERTYTKNGFPISRRYILMEPPSKLDVPKERRIYGELQFVYTVFKGIYRKKNPLNSKMAHCQEQSDEPQSMRSTGGTERMEASSSISEAVAFQTSNHALSGAPRTMSPSAGTQALQEARTPAASLPMSEQLKEDEEDKDTNLSSGCNCSNYRALVLWGAI